MSRGRKPLPPIDEMLLSLALDGGPSLALAASGCRLEEAVIACPAPGRDRQNSHVG